MNKVRTAVAAILLISFLWSCQDTTESLTVHVDSTAIRFFQRTKGWIASDGANSVPLSDGRTLWLMGDSHINDYDSVTHTIPLLFQVRNSALLQPGNDWNWHDTKTLIGNGPGLKNLFKINPSDKYFIWPGSGFQLGDTVYCYLGNLMKTGKGAWSWGSAGYDLWGKIKFPEMNPDAISYSPLQDFNGINFGIGFVKDKHKHVIYAFGSKLGKFGQGIVYVATIPMDNPEAGWKFWDGESWSPNINQITPVDTVNAGVAVCKIRNKFVIISSDLSVRCDMGKNIYSATSDNPTGPFTPLKEIYTITDTLDGHYPFFYAAIPHTQFISKKNELLITYCINGYSPCVPRPKGGRFNPDYYRPKAIRVPLKLIAPSL